MLVETTLLGELQLRFVDVSVLVANHRRNYVTDRKPLDQAEHVRSQLNQKFLERLLK